MKKLKIKVFSVIFILLTSFTLIFLLVQMISSYMEKKKSIEDILINLKKVSQKKSYILDFDSQKIYLNYNIYTIILDDKGNPVEINNIIDKESLINILNREDDMYIGNLYTNKYSYVYTANNIIIIDNTNLNKTLKNQLILNILIFIICEIIIFVITTLITKWITIPVKNSFEKQKTFIADASHELKTPISVMIASCDAYFNDHNDKWVNNIKTESERMIKLVKELLDLARTEKEINMKLNNLSDIIEGSILTFESLFYEKNLNLTYNIDENINLICNEDLIIELMEILLDNAIKYSDKEVIVNLHKKNKQIILEVKNTGIAIKKEDEKKIFERFYKVDSSRNRNSNNYGLGLAILKNIVDVHKGVVSVHSSNGYTVFKIIWKN